jgi:hypothetical protein
LKFPVLDLGELTNWLGVAADTTPGRFPVPTMFCRGFARLRWGLVNCIPIQCTAG